MKKEVIILLVLVLFIAGCSNVNVVNKSFDSLDYEVSDCLDEGEDSLEINSVEGDVVIEQIIEFNCCFEVEMTYKVNEGILRIYQDFYGEECDCNCKKEINAEIDAEGIEEVEFYSRKDKEFPYELILETKI